MNNIKEEDSHLCCTYRISQGIVKNDCEWMSELQYLIFGHKSTC